MGVARLPGGSAVPCRRSAANQASAARSELPTMKVVDKVLRIGEGKILRQLQGIARMVNSIEDDFVTMSDEELRGQTAEFKQRHENGESLDSLLPEAYAVVREAAKRTLHQRHYDVQIMG